jgi:hypothetical protein
VDTAASARPAATSSAAAAVDDVRVSTASPSSAASHCCTCAAACGWVWTVRTAVVPGRTSTEKRTGRTASATICSRVPVARASMVVGTGPSTELSIGTHAASTRPWRTSSIAAGGVAAGTSSTASGSTSVRAAASVNVPAGPR